MRRSEPRTSWSREIFVCSLVQKLFRKCTEHESWGSEIILRCPHVSRIIHHDPWRSSSHKVQVQTLLRLSGKGLEPKPRQSSFLAGSMSMTLGPKSTATTSLQQKAQCYLKCFAQVKCTYLEVDAFPEWVCNEFTLNFCFVFKLKFTTCSRLHLC